MKKLKAGEEEGEREGYQGRILTPENKPAMAGGNSGEWGKTEGSRKRLLAPLVNKVRGYVWAFS